MGGWGGGKNGQKWSKIGVFSKMQKMSRKCTFLTPPVFWVKKAKKGQNLIREGGV